MERIKKLGIMFAALLVVSGICLIFEACQNDDILTLKEAGIKLTESEKFLYNLDDNLTNFMDASLFYTGANNSRFHDFPGTQDSLYIGFPKDSIPTGKDPDPGNMGYHGPVMTPAELIALIHNTGCTIKREKTSDDDELLLLSDEECTEALSPVIMECKHYLCAKGFTLNDIDDMLEENNATESDLVPFVLALAEREENQEEFTLSLNSTFNPLSLLSVSAYALDQEDMEKAFGCALQVIGIDILRDLSTIPPSKWTKALLKKVFKKTITRMVGPAGAVLAVIEFSICMGR